MVTVNKVGGQEIGNATEFYGLSSDIKPISTDIANGSVFVEIDTSTVYMFNAQAQTWIEQ